MKHPLRRKSAKETPTVEGKVEKGEKGKFLYVNSQKTDADFFNVLLLYFVK